jgi:SAM-dependent methyltransferase
MLEKIGTLGFLSISDPDAMVVKYLEDVLAENADPVFYEIGVGVGATTLPVAERMNNHGQLVLFSREAHVLELAADLRERGYGNVDSRWGSPGHTFSGYHFELARGVLAKELPQFDLAYLDGGHVFHLDAPATCVLKELCKPGGYIIFDDYDWNLAKSPTLNPITRPATANEYDPRQIDACHVEMVCKIMMDVDSRFELVELTKGSAVYQRIRA